MRRSLRLVPLVAALLVPACKQGPDFARPAPPAASAGYGQTGAGRALLAEGPQGKWWEAFGSAELNALVEQALAHNPSLAASNATLEAARQRIREVAGRSLPQVDANARAEHEKINLAAFGFDPSTFPGITNPELELYTVGSGVTYDLDLFGRNARALEQVRAQAEAQAHQTAAAHLTIAGRVVTQVLTIAALGDRLAAVNQLVDAGTRNVKLTDARRIAGEGTLVEVLAAQSRLSEERAQIPGLEQQLAEARAMLAVLLGISPAELPATRFSLSTFRLPSQVPVALPSALVHKRPDILSAEARLHAATAAVGVATAELYPNVTIGANLSQSAPHLADVFSSGFRGFDLFAGATAPIFHGGTLRARKRGAEAEARAAAATYRQTVLEAFGQVSTLLSALDTDARALAAERESASLAERSLDLSRKSYQIGNSGVLQVLEATRANERARLALVDAQARQALDTARLYVATAGGWLEDGATP
ncbi:MAG: efflux transporter outer membrane subunit [Sphingomonadales bacterium]|nr:efflux transporter outer membrane subunit [Sphingomonadales bacterium]